MIVKVMRLGGSSALVSWMVLHIPWQQVRCFHIEAAGPLALGSRVLRSGILRDASYDCHLQTRPYQVLRTLLNLPTPIQTNDEEQEEPSSKMVVFVAVS